LTIGSVRCATPDLARPKEALLVDVLAEIADDVRLLKKQADRVRQFELLRE